MLRALVVGSGGRESALARRLAEHSAVCAVARHRNPSLARYAEQTGGALLIAEPTDGAAITQFATRERVDLALVSADDPLAAGVVDQLLAAGIPTVGPDRLGARIEWDKLYALEWMQRLFPQYTPRFWVVRDEDSLAAALGQISEAGIEIAVKPQGLTAGKGVKVMGAHLPDLEAAGVYARDLLQTRRGEVVLLVEKIEGPEFTVMALTDGERVVGPPATYDYPYRFEGDSGPGTGGMGSFNLGSDPLPFMSEAQYRECLRVAERIVQAIQEDGGRFTGVLNVGFFVTRNGLRFLEFNARFGDPECLNIMAVLDSPLVDLLGSIDARALTREGVRFSGQASVVKYLVAPEYALSAGARQAFSLDVEAIERAGVQVLFSAAEAQAESSARGAPNRFVTVGNSRCLALVACAQQPPAASEAIERAIEEHVHGPLQWRRDIGSAAYLERLGRT